MTAGEVYALLQSSGYRLFRKDNGRLGIRGPRPLTADIMAEVRRLKPELLELTAVSDAGVTLHQKACAKSAISAKSPGAATGATDFRTLPPRGDNSGNGNGFPALPIGWTRAHWIERLRYLADQCMTLVPDRAEWLRQWSREVEQQR